MHVATDDRWDTFLCWEGNAKVRQSLPRRPGRSIFLDWCRVWTAPRLSTDLGFLNSCQVFVSRALSVKYMADELDASHGSMSLSAMACPRPHVSHVSSKNGAVFRSVFGGLEPTIRLSGSDRTSFSWRPTQTPLWRRCLTWNIFVQNRGVRGDPFHLRKGGNATGKTSQVIQLWCQVEISAAVWWNRSDTYQAASRWCSRPSRSR